MRTLATRSPFTLFDDLERELFRHTENQGNDFKTYTFENENAYFVSADIPGVKREDLSLEIEDGLLKVEAIRKSRFGDSEQNESRFARVFRIPDDVNKEQIDANLEDGVLTLILKRYEKEAPKKIQVNTGEQASGWKKLLSLGSHKE